jgi:hypothetical protein
MLRLLFVLAGCLLLSDAMAQNNLLDTKFHCRAAAGNANKLLHDLAAYSGFNIEYSPVILDSTANVVLRDGETTLGKVLNRILSGQRVSVIEKNNKIIILHADIPLPADALLERYMLYGFIQQENSLEPIPFASLRDVSARAICESNVFGFYSITLPAGEHMLQVSFTGSSSKTVTVDLIKNTQLNFFLSPALLPETQVAAGNALKKDAGIKLDRYQSGLYSNMLGETDPVRSLYLLPGNMESQESGGKLLVRGGDPGQSLFFLDGNQVFNPAHLLGEVSILGNTSIRSVQQYKNDFPARLSGGISSVTEINSKDGNMNRWSGEAEAGINAISVTLEGPLKKNRTAMMASARQSVGDAFNQDMFAYNALFGDTHVKLTHLLNRNNKLQLSVYTGNDRLQLTQDSQEYLQKWSNALFTANWNHVLNSRSFVNTTFNVSSNDNYIALMYKLSQVNDIGVPVNRNITFNNYSSGSRYEAKTQFELAVSPDVQSRFGGKFEYNILHAYNTLVTEDFKEEIDSFPVARSFHSSNLIAYYENDIMVSNNLLIRPGVQFNSYKYDTYSYQAFQPRFFSSYRIDDDQQINVSYTHTGQQLHLITSPYTGINREVWLPTSPKLRPEESRMINLGYQFKNRRLVNLTADVYYKKMNNVTSFAENVNILFNGDSVENKIITGKGWSYGAEFMCEKKFEKFKVIFSYTLSWSWRQFDSAYNGKQQPYRYDRRNQVNFLLEYQPIKKLDLSLLWHFNTGGWITLPATVSLDPEKNMINPGQDVKAPFKGPVSNRVNVNAAYYFDTKKIRHTVIAGISAINQSAMKYSTEILTEDNKSYDINTYPDELFKFNGYLTYKLSF